MNLYASVSKYLLKVILEMYLLVSFANGVKDPDNMNPNFDYVLRLLRN